VRCKSCSPAGVLSWEENLRKTKGVSSFRFQKFQQLATGVKVSDDQCIFPQPEKPCNPRACIGKAPPRSRTCRKKVFVEIDEGNSGLIRGSYPTVNSDIPCFFPDSTAAFAAKQHVTPNSSVAWGEIPWIPCTVPCRKSRFRAFWA
jgi:hypothetical protein